MKPLGLILIAVALARAAGAQDKPLALHPDNPHYFLFRGKPAVLIGSTEHYGAVMNLDIDYVTYLDTLQKDGLNLTRTFSGTYHEIPGSFGITENTLSPTNYIGPWARTATGGAADGGNKFDLAKYDDKYFARLKDFLTQAGKRGVVVEYVLFCTLYNDALWNVNPMNPKNNVNAVADPGRTEVFTLKHKDLLAFQEAFVRKTVAELNGFDNVYFEICNEPYFAGVADDWQAHIAQVIVDAEKELPNRHLIAQNIANDRKKVDKATPGVSILNFHYATPPETVAMNYGHNLVISDDETGFAGKEDVHYRTEGWDFLIAGGAAYNNLDYSFSAKHPGGDLSDYKSPGGGSKELRRSLAALKTFVDHLDFIHMKPMNGIVKGGNATVGIVAKNKLEAARGQVSIRVLGQEGKSYAVYVRGGTAAQVDLALPKGEYFVRWIDTKFGNAVKNEAFGHDGGVKRLVSPPYDDDIAVHIIAQSK